MVKILKSIFNDSFFLYKNFFHFNLSKIIILLVTILYIFVLFIPLALLFIIIFYFLGMFDGGFNPYLFIGNGYYMGFGLFFIVIGFLTYIIAYSWSTILLNNLVLGYISRKKINYSKNYYFDFKLFWTYLKLSLVVLLIIFLPILFWLLGFFILLGIFGGIQNSLQVVNTGISNSLSISLLVLTLFSFIGFIYLNYKTLFVYVILVDKYSKNNKLKKVTYYIKKSFSFTKGFKKFFKLVLVLLILLIITYPIYFFESYFSTKAKNIQNYISYDLAVKSGKDLKDKQLDFINLKLLYGKQDLKSLTSQIKLDSSLSILFYVLEFLFVWGLYNLFIVSFYKHLKN